MAKLARFTESDGSGEFVVIFDNDNPDLSEYEGEYTLAEMLTIQGDVTTFPCDRQLRDPVASGF
jgi:hypothetical protein